MSKDLEDALTIVDRIRKQLKSNGNVSDSDKRHYVAELELAMELIEKAKDEAKDKNIC